MDLDASLNQMACCQQLKSHQEIYEGYVPMEYGEYLKKMSKYWENFSYYQLEMFLA